MKTATLIAAAFLACAADAPAQTITVTTCLDVSDVPAAATIVDLPGPDGVVSFREALRVSDNEPGHQTIGFAIPVSRWWLPNIYPGLVVLQSSVAFSALGPVTIDGTTQTAFTGDTNPDGNEMVLELGVSLGGDNSVFFGFHGSTVGLGGDTSVVRNNTGAMHIIAASGSGNMIRDNEAWTIKLDRAHNNVVVGNTTDRVRVIGLNAADPATGNRIGGPDPADRNFITGWGNIGEHGQPSGTTVELYYTDGTLIENNYIGTTPDGMSIGSHASTVGIGVFSANHNLTIRNNLIASQAHLWGGTSGPAIGSAVLLDLYEGGNGILLLGNTIGLDAAGAPSLGSANGVIVGRYAFEFGADIRIGGPNPGEGNAIAGHESAGVLMLNGPGVPQIGHARLWANSIYANGAIGIDLTPNTWTFGPTPNDPLDADVGANGLQNFPVLTSAHSTGAGTTIQGALNSSANDAFQLEFFASPACGPSGFGEGAVFLGAVQATTDGAGDAPFSAILSAQAAPGAAVTATATRLSTGATSEFSLCVTASMACYANCDGSTTAPVLNVLDFGCFLNRFAAADPYANCDGSTTAPVLNVLDFGCFLNRFAAGCP